MEKNYGTIPKTLDLRFMKDKIWQITKNYKTLNFNKKTLWQFTKTIEVFEQIYSIGTLISIGKAMVLRKNYATVPKTMELCFTMENTMVLWEKTMEVK